MPSLRPTLEKPVFLIILLWGLIEGRPFLLPICIAGLAAFLMAPLQRFLSKKLKFPEFLSILVSALALLSPVLALAYILVRQGQGLIQDFPNLLQGAQAQFAHIKNAPILHRFPELQNLDLGEAMSKLSSSAGAGLGILIGGLSAIAGIGSQSILIFIFSILMLGSRTHLRVSVENLLARNKSFQKTERSHGLLNDVVSLIQRFLVARITIVAIIGALSSLALALFKVKYSIFLGTFLGAMTLVPAIGFIIALVPAVIVAAIMGKSIAALLGLIASLVLINCIENYYLTPKMVGNRLNLNALTSFIGLFAGGLLWGVWGMLLSIPVLGVLRIVFAATPGLELWGELLAQSESKGARPSLRKLDQKRAA